jgi:signal transduction histidine kinase
MAGQIGKTSFAQCHEAQFHAEQFRYLVDVVLNIRIQIIVLICVLINQACRDQGACAWLLASFYYAMVYVIQQRMIRLELSQVLFQWLATIGPVLSMCALAVTICVNDCGGKCEPEIWMPKLRVFAVSPIVWGTLFRLPFWKHLFWSRMIILSLAIICWHHIMHQNGTKIAFEEMIAATLLCTLCAWEREQTGRLLFQSQHAESTVILGAVSHDLRTPLHVISCIIMHMRSSDMRESKLGDEPNVKNLSQLEHCCKRMEGLVEDLLLASTIYNADGNDIGLTRKNTVNIRHFMLEQSEHIDYKVKQNVHLSQDIDDQVPRLVMVDEMRLSQVVTNLLNNAAKFTSKGSIKLTCTLVASSVASSGTEPGSKEKQEKQDLTTLRIGVQDTGIGIDEADIKRLRAFQLFTKIRGSETDRLNANGIGLGLPICHTLASKLGGSLMFESKKGAGKVRVAVIVAVAVVLLPLYSVGYSVG